MQLFHSHTWAKWSALVPSYRGHNMQFRQCDTCGKIQARNIGYCSGASHIDANAALKAAQTVPEASSAIFSSRCPMCSYQHGHQIGCENNPIDIALRAAELTHGKEE